MRPRKGQKSLRLALAAVALTLAFAAPALGGWPYRWGCGKEDCKPFHAEYYGHFPTCWRPWPGGWPRCFCPLPPAAPYWEPDPVLVPNGTQAPMPSPARAAPAALPAPERVPLPRERGQKAPPPPVGGLPQRTAPSQVP
jgi:hypothetical protein